MKIKFAASTIDVGVVRVNGSVIISQYHDTYVRVVGPDKEASKLDFYDGLNLTVNSDNTGILTVLLDPDAPAGDYEYRAFVSGKDGAILLDHSGKFTVALQGRVFGEYLFWDDFDIDQDLFRERYAICHGCEHNLDGVCGECGCDIASRCSNKLGACPIGKWGPPNG